MLDFFKLRRGATLTLVAMTAAALAGCNQEYQGKLDASAPPQTAANANPASPASGQTVATGAEPRIEIASVRPPEDAPFPVPRPDFGDRVADTAPATAGPATAQANPGDAAGSTAASGDAAPAVEPVRVAAAAPSQRPAGLFGLFASPAAVPRNEDDPEPPLSPTEEALHKRSFNAYEDRVGAQATGGPKATASPAKAVITATAYSPAVVEVNGVATLAGAGAAPRTVAVAAAAAMPSPALQTGGRWRAAYDHVVTHCFDSGLRQALETIGRHFKAEVEVTSGYRTNGRRRSMHRFCRAADIRVAGVPPSEVARFARTLPAINGVGTYRRRSIVHIDTRLQQMTWRY